MIAKRTYEREGNELVERILPTTAKRLAKDIVVELLRQDAIVQYAEGFDKLEWDAMTREEQRAVTHYYDQYINRLLKIVRG